jgi:hypothetical protein
LLDSLVSGLASVQAGGMNAETDLEAAPTARFPLRGRTAGEPGEQSTDPLATITMRPRTYAAGLAIAGLLLGLILALVPVHVAGLDTAEQTSVSCGNTIGGVETPLLAGDLGNVDDPVLATYVGTCQQAISTRLLVSWPLFVAGLLGVIWLGAVRHTPQPNAPTRSPA